MNCEEYKKELKNWLESRWEVEDDDEIKVPGHLKEHSAECSQCASRLKAALLLIDGKSLRKTPPEGLSRCIAERLAEDSVPRVVPWQRWASLAAAAVFIVGISFFVTDGFFQSPNSNTVVVRLVLEAPGVSEVMVVGDWNGWDPAANRLTDEDGDGIWEIELRLKRGEEQQYQFLIDGERWVADPQAPLQVEDGFGGFNSILQI